jgi:phage gpG-like protein
VNASACRAALRDVRKTIEELARLPHKLAVVASPDITRELQSQFTGGKDPYGRPWAPLKPSTLRKHGPPPLTDSGRLKSGTFARPGRGGILVEIGASYGAFHQLGFRVHGTKVPARKILPARGMPAAWRAILDRRAREIAREATR